MHLFKHNKSLCFHAILLASSLMLPFIAVNAAFAVNAPPSMISAKHSGKCLDIPSGATTNGANITQWDCHGGENQQFTYVDKGNGYGTIANKRSGKCLDIAGGATSNGAKVLQWDCHGGDNQLFSYTDKGNGYGTIGNKRSGKCLDIERGGRNNGAKVLQWDCHGGANQLFRITVAAKPVVVSTQQVAPSVVNGNNVVMVTLQGAGSFADYDSLVNYHGKFWQDKLKNGQIGVSYDEVSRDDGSVSLKDKIRGVYIRIDLKTKEITWSNSRNQGIFGKITESFSRKNAPASFQQIAGQGADAAYAQQSKSVELSTATKVVTEKIISPPPAIKYDVFYKWVAATIPPANTVAAPEAPNAFVCRGKSLRDDDIILGNWNAQATSCYGFLGQLQNLPREIEFLTIRPGATAQWVPDANKNGDEFIIGTLPQQAIDAGENPHSKTQFICSRSGLVGWVDSNTCRIGQRTDRKQAVSILVGVVDVPPAITVAPQGGWRYAWVVASTPPSDAVTAPDGQMKPLCRGLYADSTSGWLADIWHGYWNGARCISNGGSGERVEIAQDGLQFLTQLDKQAEWVKGHSKGRNADVGSMPDNPINSGMSKGGEICAEDGYIGWVKGNSCRIYAPGINIDRHTTILAGRVVSSPPVVPASTNGKPAQYFWRQMGSSPGNRGVRAPDGNPASGGYVCRGTDKNNQTTIGNWNGTTCRGAPTNTGHMDMDPKVDKVEFLLKLKGEEQWVTGSGKKQASDVGRLPPTVFPDSKGQVICSHEGMIGWLDQRSGCNYNFNRLSYMPKSDRNMTVLAGEIVPDLDGPPVIRSMGCSGGIPADLKCMPTVLGTVTRYEWVAQLKYFTNFLGLSSAPRAGYKQVDVLNPNGRIFQVSGMPKLLGINGEMMVTLNACNKELCSQSSELLTVIGRPGLISLSCPNSVEVSVMGNVANTHCGPPDVSVGMPAGSAGQVNTRQHRDTIPLLNYKWIWWIDGQPHTSTQSNFKPQYSGRIRGPQSVFLQVCLKKYPTYCDELTTKIDFIGGISIGIGKYSIELTAGEFEFLDQQVGVRPRSEAEGYMEAIGGLAGGVMSEEAAMAWDVVSPHIK